MVLLFLPRILIIQIIPTIPEQLPTIPNTLHMTKHLNHLFLHLPLAALCTIGLYHILILNHPLAPTTPILTHLLCLCGLTTPLVHRSSHIAALLHLFVIHLLLLVPLPHLFVIPPLLLAIPPLLLATPPQMHLENQNLIILILTHFLILLITKMNNDVLKITFLYL